MCSMKGREKLLQLEVRTDKWAGVLRAGGSRNTCCGRLPQEQGWQENWWWPCSTHPGEALKDKPMLWVWSWRYMQQIQHCVSNQPWWCGRRLLSPRSEGGTVGRMHCCSAPCTQSTAGPVLTFSYRLWAPPPHHCLKGSQEDRRSDFPFCTLREFLMQNCFFFFYNSKGKSRG